MDDCVVDQRGSIYCGHCLTPPTGHAIARYITPRPSRGILRQPDHIFVFWWFCDGPCPGESRSAQTHRAKHYPENRHLPGSCTVGIHDSDWVLEHVDQQYSHGSTDAANSTIRDSFIDRGQ